MKRILKDKKVLYIIAGVVVALLLCVGLAMLANKGNSSDNAATEEDQNGDNGDDSSGLQVEENADDGEGDSIDFGELDNKYEVDEDGNVIDKTTGNVVPDLKVDSDGNIVDSNGDIVQENNPNTGSGNTDSGSGNTNSGSGDGFGTLF